MWIWLLDRYHEWTGAWSAWLHTGPVDPRTPLWGTHLYVWVRGGKIVAFLAGAALVVDLIGAERLRSWAAARKSGTLTSTVESSVKPLLFLPAAFALLGLAIFLIRPSQLRDAVGTTALSVFSPDVTVLGVLLLASAIALLLTIMIFVSGILSRRERHGNRLDLWRYCGYVMAATGAAYFVIIEIGRRAALQKDARFSQFLLTWADTAVAVLVIGSLAILTLARAVDQHRESSRLWRCSAMALLLIGVQFDLLSS